MGKFPRYGGRGTPQGGFSCPCGAIHLQPLPYESQENPPCLGRGAPWGSRRGQAKRSPSSAPFGGTFPLGGGRLRARQDTHRKRWLRKPRHMSGTAPATIFANLGPSGPAGIQTSHSDFARRKFCRTHQECVPRNGVRGKATMSTKCSSGAVPGGVLPSFSPWKKKVAARTAPAGAFRSATAAKRRLLARRWRRNPLRNFPRKQGGIP